MPHCDTSEKELVLEKKERIELDRLDVSTSETPANSHFSWGVLPFFSNH
jgi:hypothetical protein